jgi:hypothetical protein
MYCEDGKAGIAHSVHRRSYRIDDRGIGVKYPAGAKDSSLVVSVQIGSGAHPDSSYPTNSGALLPQGTAAGA